jgi:STAS-like domain of unknown function (DUF4325)
MNMPTIDVGTEFYHRLANRDKNQGDGKHTAVEFRTRYLAHLDNPAAWQSSGETIILDFANVKKIGPSFANEAFGYFTKYVKPADFLKRVQFRNISDVQLMIIKEELDSGYTGK